MIHLRAHHLLCLQYFVGEGYSDLFTQSMADVQNRLQKGESWCLADGMDDICKDCPNNMDGICRTQEKVERYDEKIRSLLSGTSSSYSSVSQLLQKDNLLQSICPDCSWNALCQKIRQGKK